MTLPEDVKGSQLHPCYVFQAPTCSICLDSDVNAIFTSCGHTCCLECGERVKRVKENCHICRKKIDSVIRMFLS